MKLLLYIFLLTISFDSYAQEPEKNELFTFRSRENGKIGYMNKNNKIVIKPQYATGTYFENNDYAAVSIKNGKTYKFAVIDLKGNYIIPFEEGYELISLNTEIENWILVVKNGKWGYINYKKEILIPLDYDNLGHFYGNLAFAQKNGKYGFIDSNNNTIIDFQFDWTINFGRIQPDGLRYVKVQKESKIGYINNKGELIAPYLYDSAKPFFKGVAVVKKGKKYGCINTKGKVIVPFNFEFITNYKKFIIAQKEFSSENEYYYNRQGEFIRIATKKKK